MTADESFAVGDRVKWREGTTWSMYDVYGTVKRVGDASITVTPDKGDKPKVFRASRYGRRYLCEKVSKIEIERLEWRRRKPAASIIDVTVERGGLRLYLRTAAVGQDGLDSAILDLQAFKAWLAERPGGGS